MGFDLDRLNSEVLALRTLPRFVPQNICRDITFCLIKYFGQNKVTGFNVIEFKSFLEVNWPVTSPIAAHILTNILEDNIIKTSTLVLLDSKNLKSLL